MIVISTQCYPPKVGGIEFLMSGLSAELSASGNDVVVFADGAGNKEERKFDTKQPYPVYRYAGIKLWRRRKKAKDIAHYITNHKLKNLTLLTDSWKSLELINQSHFDKILCLVHGTEISSKLSRKKATRIRDALAKSTHIIANSEYTAKRIRPHIDTDGKLRVIYPGINVPKKDTTIIEKVKRLLVDHDPVLITVARLEKRKGHHHVLELIPKLIKQFPKLIYIILGEGSQMSALESTIQSRSLQNHVLFMQTTNEQERNAYISNSDLFIMPGDIVENDVEGFGMAYIEAASFGIPSIACNVGGVNEAVVHNETGLVCPPGDQQQLYSYTLKLLEDSEFREKLGISAQKRSMNFLWPEQIKQYKKLLHS